MDTVKNILEGGHFAYEFIYHNQPQLTVQECAAFFGIDAGQTAPTLIIRTNKDFFALVISGSSGCVNFQQLSFILGCKKIGMTSKEEVKKVTGFDARNLPMIGIPLPYILDRELFSYPYVYGGSGQLNRTLKITPLALKQLNTVITITTVFRG